MTGPVLILTGILSGPVSAFLLGYPLFLGIAVFVPVGLMRLGGRWLVRMLLLASAPAAFAVYGLLTGNGEMLHRALRWCVALSAGMYFAGELDTHMLLSKVRTGGGPVGTFFRDLVLLLSLAGPAARRARETFSRSRRNGLRLAGSVEESLMSIGEPFTEAAEPQPASPRIPVFLAVLSWILMLWTVAGAGTAA